MTTFLFIAAILALCVAWLLAMPVLTTANISRKEKQKTVFFILLGTIVFPLVFYLFLAH